MSHTCRAFVLFFVLLLSLMTSAVPEHIPDNFPLVTAPKRKLKKIETFNDLFKQCFEQHPEDALLSALIRNAPIDKSFVKDPYKILKIQYYLADDHGKPQFWESYSETYLSIALKKAATLDCKKEIAITLANINVLLETGANPNVQVKFEFEPRHNENRWIDDSWSGTAAHLAILLNVDHKILETFFEHGACINADARQHTKNEKVLKLIERFSKLQKSKGLCK